MENTNIKYMRRMRQVRGGKLDAKKRFSHVKSTKGVVSLGCSMNQIFIV